MSGLSPDLLARLGDELAALARQAAQEAVRQALADAPGPRPTFTTLAAHAKRQGLGASTLRRWCRTAGVERQPNGRYRLADLERVIATRGAPAPAPVSDLVAERARRAAVGLRGGAR